MGEGGIHTGSHAANFLVKVLTLALCAQVWNEPDLTE